MIIAIVGSGGKTTLLKKMAASFRAEGKRVFVTTTTHMFQEENMLLTDDPQTIIRALQEEGENIIHEETKLQSTVAYRCISCALLRAGHFI